MQITELYESRQKRMNLSYIHSLTCMALMDGSISKEEQEFVFNKAHRMGLTPDDLRHMAENPEGIKFTIPTSFEECLVHLYDLVLIMMMDGQVNEKEMRFCKIAGTKLGFSSDKVEFVIIEIMRVISKGYSEDEAMSKLAKTTVQ